MANNNFSFAGNLSYSIPINSLDASTHNVWGQNVSIPNYLTSPIRRHPFSIYQSRGFAPVRNCLGADIEDDDSDEEEESNSHTIGLVSRSVQHLRDFEDVEEEEEDNPHTLELIEFINLPENSPSSGGNDVEFDFLDDGESLFPRYSSYENRKKTFENWPKALLQQANELAESGLFYSNKGDECICFSCGSEYF
jgi:hypothetical protein